MDRTISLLRDLIAIDSVNPSLVPGGAGEAAVADRVAQEFRSMGLATELQEAAPGRPNVVGVIDGRAPGPALMFCGHLDTVGVAGMAAPFDPVERGGRLYGRGSQDMKGGVAAMIGAAREIVHHGGLARGRLLVAGVIDEEHASLGAEALVARWRADGAIVTEPTALAIGIGHKGFEWVEVVTRGRAAHGSRPADGRDAILRMGRVMSRLDRLDRELQARTPHPLVGAGSLHASLIEGGRELSSYPDRCVLQLERRTIPGEHETVSTEEVAGILRSLKSDDPEFEGEVRHVFGRPPYEVSSDHPLPAALTRAISSTGRAAQTIGMPFWTDAAILGAAGIPSVLFGPGGAGLHSVEEYVVVDDVLACQQALVAMARAFCGV